MIVFRGPYTAHVDRTVNTTFVDSANAFSPCKNTTFVDRANAALGKKKRRKTGHMSFDIFIGIARKKNQINTKTHT